MDDFAEEEVVENPTLRAAYNQEPLHQNQSLCWDYEVKLIGEKIYDKVIHLCETCELPILVYGRLLPCKHIFCFDCARKCDKSCKRCSAKVQKVEKSALGTVYVCTHGAPKHSTKGCRRTYLSQRDLQAHVAHRHMPKSSSSSSMSSSAPLQPAPNQLPLTKQQAAQQASQKQVGTQDMSHASPVQSHVMSSILPGQNSLAPPMNSLPLSHQQQSGLPINSQQLSPAPPLIPGLGDLRPLATAAQSSLGQNSPLMQPSQSPSNMPQGMGMSYGAAPQPNPDMFHPMEMAQQQQHQQAMGIPNSHLQSNQTHQSYPPPAQFPVSTTMMQQMNSQQLSSTVSASMHPNAFTHSHPSMSVPQNLDNYNELQNMPPTQSRTNVNLITVPIQDEGQYRPIPYINSSSLAPHPGSSYPQSRPNMPNQTQAYTQPQMLPGTFSTPTTFPQMAPQAQNMTTPNSPQGLAFNQPNTMHANSPGVMVNPRQVMGGNVHTNVPRALADVMHAMTMAAAATRAQGQPGGLMPTPVPGGQGVVNRFPPAGNWTPQRMMPPRIQQPQQRPQTDGQFNQSGYYH